MTHQYKNSLLRFKMELNPCECFVIFNKSAYEHLSNEHWPKSTIYPFISQTPLTFIDMRSAVPYPVTPGFTHIYTCCEYSHSRLAAVCLSCCTVSTWSKALNWLPEGKTSRKVRGLYSTLWKWEWFVLNQVNTGSVWRATLGGCWETDWGRACFGLFECNKGNLEWKLEKETDTTYPVLELLLTRLHSVSVSQATTAILIGWSQQTLTICHHKIIELQRKTETPYMGCTTCMIKRPWNNIAFDLMCTTWRTQVLIKFWSSDTPIFTS